MVRDVKALLLCDLRARMISIYYTRNVSEYLNGNGAANQIGLWKHILWFEAAYHTNDGLDVPEILTIETGGAFAMPSADDMDLDGSKGIAHENIGG